MSSNWNSSYLSTEQRKQIKILNFNIYNKLLKDGDRAHENGDYATEAIKHRQILEKMNLHQNIKLKDPESQDAWNKNCVLVHEEDHARQGQELGLTFEQMFSQKSNGTYKMSFEHIQRPSYISTTNTLSNYCSPNSVNNNFCPNSLYQASQNMSLDEMLNHLR